MARKTKKNQRIKVNVRPVNIEDKVELERPLITQVPINSMEIGLGYTNATRKYVRCVRWREMGICKYILIGFDRGRVLNVIRNFRKIRELTPKEKQKVMLNVKVFHELL